jgi:hypothetical protein
MLNLHIPVRETDTSISHLQDYCAQSYGDFLQDLLVLDSHFIMVHIHKLIINPLADYR